MNVGALVRKRNSNFRKSDDPEDKGYIFDSQIDTAKDVVSRLLRKVTRKNHVILAAKMQSGKTGVCNAIINLVSQSDAESELMVKKYMFITGMNDCGLKEQTLKRLKEQVIGAKSDNIYKGRKMSCKASDARFIVMKNSDLMKYDGDIDNTLIFIDESHYGSNEKNVLSKFLYKHNIDWRDTNELIRRNIYIVSVSATPFDEIVSDTEKCKRVIELKASDDYVGVTEFINNGLIYESCVGDIECDGAIFDYIDDAYQRMMSDGISGAIIIRTRKFDIIESNSFIRDKFDVFEMYSAGSNIEYEKLNSIMRTLIRKNRINSLLSKNTKSIINNVKDVTLLKVKPVIVLIKGAFRAGITIEPEFKDLIYMVYDHSSKADTTAQALLGRMCGYRESNSPIEHTRFYVNSKFASMYSDWENNMQDRDIVPCNKVSYKWVGSDYSGKTEFGTRSRGNFYIDLTDDEVIDIVKNKDSCGSRVEFMGKKMPELLSKRGIHIDYDYIGEAVISGRNKYTESTIKRRFDVFSKNSTPYEFRPRKIKKFVDKNKRDYLISDDVGTSAIYVLLDAIVSDDGTISGKKRLLVYNVEVALRAKVPNVMSMYKPHKDTRIEMAKI